MSNWNKEIECILWWDQGWCEIESSCAYILYVYIVDLGKDGM